MYCRQTIPLRRTVSLSNSVQLIASNKVVLIVFVQQEVPSCYSCWHHIYKGTFMEIFILCTLDITEVTSTQSHLVSTLDNFVILCGCKGTKLSHMDARWLCKSHLVCVRWQICLVWLWGDFAKVYKGKLMEIFIICALDIIKITSTHSHLTSMRDNFAILYGCEVAKLSHVDTRWLCKSHLTWPF